MEGLQEVTNALSNGTIRDPLRPPLPVDLGSQSQPKLQSLFSQEQISYAFEIFYSHSKTFRALIHKEHRVVIFAIAHLSCLFLCLSVTSLLNDFARKALEYRNDFDTVGQGKVCSCAPTLTFLCPPPTATPQNAEFQKWQNMGFFRRQRAIK